LGEYRAAGQLQQRPSPAGGGILQVKKFKLWPAKSELPDFFFVIQSYDTAFTDQTQNDPTACTTFGIFELADKSTGS
jgi:phage terminase large subunit-like protein